MNTETSAEREASKLINWGYRRTSCAHGLISRIDKADWYRYMAHQHTPWDPNGEGIDWVFSMGNASAEDHYRRCYSKDTRTVSLMISKLIPSSGGAVTGYCRKKGEPERYDVCRGDILEDDTMSEEFDLKNMYKIHSLKVVNGEARPPNNQKFYYDEHDAIDRAKECVKNSDCEIVIFKAVMLVRRTGPPIEVLDAETGEVL